MHSTVAHESILVTNSSKLRIGRTIDEQRKLNSPALRHVNRVMWVTSTVVRRIALICALSFACSLTSTASAQVKPSASEVKSYRGLHAAAAVGKTATIRRLLANGANPNARDNYGRTPCHVAAHFKRRVALQILLKGGCDPNALERDRYDIVTIAGVADDPETLRVALANGAKATNVTSRYDGTALIASAHLGHDEVVRLLVEAGAPLDHVNNLGWTALIEAIILGDGGRRHTNVVRILVSAGADVNLADGNGKTPLTLATSRNYTEMMAILTAAGAR
jgi:uncharacterized protein